MKQDAFAVVSDIVRETRPFLEPYSIAGGTNDFTVAVSYASGLLGKIGSVGGVDVFRSSRRHFERPTNTTGSQINGAPYSAAAAAER